MVANPFVVIPVEPLITAIHPLKFIVRALSLEGHARNHEVVRAQDLGHSVDDICVQPADRGTHRDHRSDAYDDADEGQKGPQFVSEDRLQGNLQGIRVKGK